MTQAADWRSGPRWSATSMLYLVHPFASSRHFTHREACHWIRGSLLSPMNPVPLPPQGETRALRDWLSVSYSMISVLVISRYAAPPYPAAPDFPPSGGQNKTPRDNLLINPPIEMTVAAISIQSFQKGTNDKKRCPHPRHFDRSGAEWRNLPL